MTEKLAVTLAGEKVAVKVRRNAKAKRLILRIDSHTGDIKLTLPTYVNLKTAQSFVDRQQDWLLKERSALNTDLFIENNSLLPLLGQEHEVVFTGVAPRTIEQQQDRLLIGGPIDMAPRRLEKWLRSEAKRLLSERAADHADRLGLSYSRISIGDMKSRWGSCSSTGTLRFSWRLVMAPAEVLDYVAAHEVSHLAEMNHSDRFWALVERCVPAHKELRCWLKTEGNALFKIRFP